MFSKKYLALLVLAALASPSADAAGLCQIDGWQCAALTATVGRRTVSSIHDPMHRDDRLLDGGIADISIRAGQLLTLSWNAQADKENKTKPRIRVDVISNKPAPSGCKEPEWADETLSGSTDVDLSACNEGRNFVVTYRLDQGREKGEQKTVRIRVHVLAKDANIDGTSDRNAYSVMQYQKSPDLSSDEEADFTKLLSF